MSQSRLVRGFVWGVIATLAMSVVMVAGVLTGLAPMPMPIPVAIVATLLDGGGIPQPLLLALAIGAHLAYGGAWGAVLATFARPVTITLGIGLGIVLWLIMQVVVLPFLGWGAFGAAVTPAIAVATLVLHLVYGLTLGWVADRETAVERQPARYAGG
jgi:hypothetical protein